VSLFLSLGLLLLAALGHGYLWTDAVNRLHAWSGPRWLIDALTYLSFLAFLVLPVAVAMLWNDAVLIDTVLYDENMSLPPSRWALSYFYFCTAWGVYSLIVNNLRRFATDNPRALLDWQQEYLDIDEQLGIEVLRAGLPQLIAKIPGNQVLQLTVDRKRLAIPQLHPKHEGLKIAHLSDLHMIGSLGLRWFEVVAEQVNELQPDVIAITGDIVEKEACWPWLASSLGILQAKYGVYFILGNHDFYIDTNHTKKLLVDQGLICLSECWVETEWNGVAVILAGSERPWAPQAEDLPTVPSHNTEQLSTEQLSTDTAQLRLMLMHTPDEYHWACQQNAHLALAGHLHGGQLRFPLLGPIACPSRFGTRYACGVFRQEDTVLHVSRGISGKTPLRWNCPPEIAMLELVAV